MRMLEMKPKGREQFPAGAFERVDGGTVAQWLEQGTRAGRPKHSLHGRPSRVAPRFARCMKELRAMFACDRSLRWLRARRGVESVKLGEG